MRSISTIISTLRTSFRDTDFTEAESELTSMEHKLRSNYNASQLQRSELTLQNLRLEEENSLLKREFEISDRRVSELARELSVVKEREKKGIERYHRLMKDVRVLENEKEKISMELCEKNEEVDEKIRVLESEKGDFEVELDGLRRENEGFVVLKAKTAEEMEKMRDLEDEIKDLRVELCEKCEEICDLKGVESKNEEEIKELLKRNELLESEMERLKRKVVVLEMEKCDFKLKFDELCRENERLGANVKEKDRRIEELKREEGLEMEKSGIMKEKEDVTGKYEEVEERLLKVEEDVANWLLQNVSIAKMLMGDQVEKVISGVLSALDSEQDGWTGRVEDIMGIDSFASHLNEAEAKTTSSFETEILSDTEVGKVNGTIGIKRDASLEVVVLSDSDCENEDPSPLSEPKRQRVLSQCRNQSMKLENCSQNSSCKFKQLVDLPNEDSELKPSSIAASHRSDKFVTSKKQEVNETIGDKVKGSMSHGMVDDDSSQHNDLSPQANVSCRPEIRKLIATCRRSRHR